MEKKTFIKRLLLLSFIVLSGCINVRMSTIQPNPGNTLSFKGVIDTPEETTNYDYPFQMGTGRFTLYLGESFVNYISYYVNTIENHPTNKLKIFIQHFEMRRNQYHIQNCVANLETHFVITQNEKIIFDKTYKTKGTVQQKKKKVYGMNPSLRKATNNAVSKAFEQFSLDISNETDPKIKEIIGLTATL